MLHISICLVSIEPEFSALGVHIWFAKCKRINVRLVFQVRQGVIDESVRALVGADGIYHIQQGRIGFETPIIFGDLWSRMFRPLWEAALFDVSDTPLPFKMSGKDDHR